MKLALMQPYFFPYIGYYQLAHSVDEFVFYDDANFIKQGYINRNAILLNRQRFDFSLPVASISSFRAIREHDYTNQFKQFEKQLRSAYSKAPNFHPVMELIQGILEDGNLNVAERNARTIRDVFSYLDIERKFSFSSSIDIPDEIRGQDKVIEVCRTKYAKDYHNSIGGRALYDQATFKSAKISLKFLQTISHSYSQGFNGTFLSNLSMIDVLMWCDIDQVKRVLESYVLEYADQS